jgi:site-specific recombinase XerC
MFGAAIRACELAGLPRSAIDLSRLKLRATGKGNAKKPEMQAAAKARSGVDLKMIKLTPRGLEPMR